MASRTAIDHSSGKLLAKTLPEVSRILGRPSSEQVSDCAGAGDSLGFGSYLYDIARNCV